MRIEMTTPALLFNEIKIKIKTQHLLNPYLYKYFTKFILYQ